MLSPGILLDAPNYPETLVLGQKRKSTQIVVFFYPGPGFRLLGFLLFSR